MNRGIHTEPTSNQDDSTGRDTDERRVWCSTFLERLAGFLDSQAGRNRCQFRYAANPGEFYRVRFDHCGVVRVTEWGTGRHVVSSLPGRPTVPDMMNTTIPTKVQP
jgi:hypothetical protein